MEFSLRLVDLRFLGQDGEMDINISEGHLNLGIQFNP